MSAKPVPTFAHDALAPQNDRTATPVELVDTAQLPDGGELLLWRRGDDYSIRFGEDELMGNQVRHSEEALATLVCERLSQGDARILIGGLGMGFTLGAALSSLSPAAEVVVAELVPEIVKWARGPLAHLFQGHLVDSRLSLEMADVHDVIVRRGAEFDAILLDVDNGPDGMIHLPNERLYCDWGLRAARDALRPGGILAIWSAYTDDDFVDRLENAGFDVEEVSIPALAGEEHVVHTIWLASKGG
ncbi:spermidine synthase [Sphingobium sp. PNB]|uniref:spermidine synthase n=1 Tax=Sphingobium sp. PNB TaxID=863934 RepID=UPI001D00B820|nr:spermidine synthase [Sphingobium sp. PNB]MCB4862783.1 spermidine synthase [Sphingobium sp. PNB]